jgi:uroporphyrin-3 C-methyltransferase
VNDTTAPASSAQDAGGSPAAAATAADAATPASQLRRTPAWPGWLALLIAVVGAGGVGYLWWTQQQKQGSELARLEALDTTTETTNRELKSLTDQLATLSRSGDDLKRDVGGLDERIASQQRQLDELPLRLSRLERAVDELPGIANASRAAWLISEAEYYLRIANAQLQLARNPDVALRALELADEKLRDIADPGLTPVRARLADEMTALRALPRPDVEGTVLAIGSLARSLDALPMSRQAPERFGQDQSMSDEAGWARAWARIRAALLSLVRIKQTDEAVTPLRTPAEESLLLRRLESQLELARLALLQGDAALYRALLDDVKTSLRRHFDTDAPPVRAAINELSELSDIDLPTELPDISGSLEMLQRLAREAAVS